MIQEVHTISSWWFVNYESGYCYGFMIKIYDPNKKIKVVVMNPEDSPSIKTNRQACSKVPWSKKSGDL